MHEHKRYSRIAHFAFWIIFLLTAVVASIALAMSIDAMQNDIDWSLILPDKILATKTVVMLFFWPVVGYVALIVLWNVRPSA